MRVIMLLDNHFGPDRRVEFEAELLQREGVEVRIVAWDRRPAELAAAAPEEEEGGLEVVRINVPAPTGGGRVTMRRMIDFGRLVWRRRAALLGDGDLLIVHDVYLLALGWALHRRARLPFVYDAHEEYAVAEAMRLPQWWLRAVTAMETRLARGAEFVVVPGESRVERWVAAGFRRPIVMRNIGADTHWESTAEPIEYDLAYAGALVDQRRVDLLIDLARLRPDLRIAAAGRGRAAGEVEAAAAELPNLHYLAWVSDPDALLRRARCVYYGLDPGHPYSEKACPNNLYQAIHMRRPLLFFCGGEVAEASARFNIGRRTAPTAAAMSEALDEILAQPTEAWNFEEAWEALAGPQATQPYVDAVLGVLGSGDRANPAC